MSEDRLEKALEALKQEPVDSAAMETAQQRVRRKLESETPLCDDFRRDFQDYMRNRLPESRRLLLEDHLGRCPGCRAHLAEIKGESKVHTMPERRVSRRPRLLAWAVAAAVLLCGIYLGRGSIDRLLAPRGPIATVASVDGRIFLVPNGMLKVGDTLSRDQVVRTAAGTHARLRLSDGSLVDLNQSTELSVQGAWSGDSIQLKRGDIIVQAARQQTGHHLRVRTRDSLTSVRGTVFAVSSGISGSLVSVVEGSVAVQYADTSVLLSPGEQEATNPQLESTVQDAVSWSPDADTYISMLSSLVQVGRQIAELPRPQLPAQSGLLPYLPSNVVVYGAIPNLGDNIDQAVDIIENQAAVNTYVSQWWNSDNGRNLKAMIDAVQTLTPHLGNEIAFGICANPPSGPNVPVILAMVLPDEKDGLNQALQAFGTESNPAPLAYYLNDTLLVASNTNDNLSRLIEQLGKGASTPFASEIAARYSQGANWLLGIDAHSMLSLADNAPPFIQNQQVKRVFFSNRNASGVPENEMTLAFEGPRTSLASFIADTGSGGAAEYIPADAPVAGYIATLQPQQMFEEIVAQIATDNPEILDNLEQVKAGIGIDISNDLAYALGSEAAFSVESISTAGPAWTLSVMVNDSDTLEGSLQKLVDAFNAGLVNAGEAKSVLYSRQTIDGRQWSSIQPDWTPIGITWTYDHGYLVAASDRATALRAITARNDGSPLVWSAAFQQQYPASVGLYPSGFFWLNPKGALQDFAALIRNPEYQDLVSGSEPILVVCDAKSEQIRTVSRDRVSNLLTYMLMLRGLSAEQSE
jgi:hypothetical protein